MTVAAPGRVGQLASRQIDGAWLVDPVAGREGPARIVIRDGVLREVAWL